MTFIHKSWTLRTSWPAAPQAVRILMRSPFLKGSSNLNRKWTGTTAVFHYINTSLTWGRNAITIHYISGCFFQLCDVAMILHPNCRDKYIQMAENFNSLPKMLMNSSSSCEGIPSTRFAFEFSMVLIKYLAGCIKSIWPLPVKSILFLELSKRSREIKHYG